MSKYQQNIINQWGTSLVQKNIDYDKNNISDIAHKVLNNKLVPTTNQQNFANDLVNYKVKDTKDLNIYLQIPVVIGFKACNSLGKFANNHNIDLNTAYNKIKLVTSASFKPVLENADEKQLYDHFCNVYGINNNNKNNSHSNNDNYNNNYISGEVINKTNIINQKNDNNYNQNNYNNNKVDSKSIESDLMQLLDDNTWSTKATKILNDSAKFKEFVKMIQDNQPINGMDVTAALSVFDEGENNHQQSSSNNDKHKHIKEQLKQNKIFEQYLGSTGYQNIHDAAGDPQLIGAIADQMSMGNDIETAFQLALFN